jgi:hypothetical protein
MRVAVIGCGPAGLAAVHAAAGLEAEVTLIAPVRQTPQEGRLLIQRPIPGINTGHPDGYIRQIVIGGTILDYRYKLYGDVNIQINGDILADGYHAWFHRMTYDKLWDRYIFAAPIDIEDRLVTSPELAELHKEFDLVVNTAPLRNLCYRGHLFEGKSVWVTRETSYPDQPDNTIIFNAYPDIPWVRSSLIFGEPVTEWPTDTSPHNATARIITKPIRTDCNCFPRVLHTGRFGAWRNETWVDTAYYDTRSALVSATHKDMWDVISQVGRRAR